MDKVVVFDLGGTLMEYIGMPLSWADYYYKGFKNVIRKFDLDVNDDNIENAVNVLKNYNPRINYRENEIEPELIFKEAIESWNINIDILEIVSAFFEGIELKARVFDYSESLIRKYKKNGYYVACLTDIPNAMPDEMFKDSIKTLLNNIDLYVSSQSCGYRKPNAYGLKLIAKHFGVDVKDILFIGDEDKDKKTAENAECKFYFIEQVLEGKI